MMRPLVARLGTAVPNDLGDPLLNTWILWWDSRHLPLTPAWWNAPAFYPLHDVLAFSDHLLGLSVLTTPLLWLTANALLAYNLALLLTFVLSATSACYLGLTLAGRRDVAFVVGLATAFAPYRMGELSHVQVLAGFWVPLVLAGLHRFVETRRLRWLVLFSVGVAMQGLTSGYYLLFLPVLLVLWVVWFVPLRTQAATALAIAGGFAAAVAVQVPFLLRYAAVHAAQGFERTVAETISHSSGPEDLLRCSPDLTLWGRWLGRTVAAPGLFPGVTVVLLVVAGVVLSRRGRATDAGEPRPILPAWARVALAMGAVSLSILAVQRAVGAPLRVSVFGRALSTGSLPKLLSEALYLWLLVAGTGPRARRLLASRSPFAFYTAATLVMWSFCFGPVVKVAGVEVLHWAPYSWLLAVPGFSGVRVPSRFAMLATPCLAAAAGLALKLTLARLGRTAGRVLLAAAAVGIVAEGWIRLTVQEPPEPSIVLADDAAGGVLELPLLEPPGDVAAAYRGVLHRHPVVNGYSGYEPSYHAVLRLALRRRAGEPLAVLASHGVRHVVVFHDQDPGGRWRQLVGSFPGVREVRRSENQTLYSLPAATGPACPPERVRVPVASVEADLNPEDVRRMLDGDSLTRWSTGRPQEPGEGITVDLGGVRDVTEVELALGPYFTDFPRELRVEGSLERQGWLPLWQGRAGGRAVEGVLEELRSMPLRCCFPPVGVRYLRLRQTGNDPTYYWTVAELRVFGPPALPGTKR